MRLRTNEIDTIKDTIDALLPDVTIKLFGSRVDDEQKGGDVDLLIISEQPVERPAWTKAQIEARLTRALHGRKVDIVLDAPNLVHGTIHHHANKTGVLLTPRWYWESWVTNKNTA